MSEQEQVELLESRMVELGMLLAIARQEVARKKELPVNTSITTMDGGMVQADLLDVEGGENAHTGVRTPEHIGNPVVQHYSMGTEATSDIENLVEVPLGNAMNAGEDFGNPVSQYGLGNTTMEGRMEQADLLDVEGGGNAHTGVRTPEHIGNPVVQQYSMGTRTTSTKENLVGVPNSAMGAIPFGATFYATQDSVGGRGDSNLRHVSFKWSTLAGF